MTHGLPKYFTICQKIIEQIKHGKLLPGMKVPSEHEIIEKYHVSNTTARKILQEIENMGWAVRIKGKGTFVRTANVERAATRILGFTRNMIEAGFTPSTRLLSARHLPGGYSAIINDRFYAIKGPVYMIKRLRFADDIPMMLEERYISLAFCPDIAERNLEGSLYDLYNNAYGLHLTEVNQMLSSITLDDPKVMALFHLTQPISAFLVEGVTFIAKEIILEMEKSIYRGDKYRFSVRAT
ncbi:MAG: GntR family transcriptional regulator [Candidatus Sumerlaeia bacterium]|nr:GntR family transcriptional regulator [Candidatus Sumerlaeia bacterium]